MNKVLSFCAGICLLTSFSCTKSSLKTDLPGTITERFVTGHKKNSAGSSNSRLSEPSLIPVTLAISGTYSGQYVSSYSSAGVTFGSTLPHPIDDRTGIYDGYPIAGSIGFVNYMLAASACATVVNGAYFTIFEPTFPTTGLTVSESTVNSIIAYDNALNAIFQEPYSATVTQATKNAQVASIPNPTINVTVNGPGTFIIVKGLLIRDHTSPTMMSIVTDKFVTPPITGPLEVIGGQTVSGYLCSMSAPPNGPQSGPITSVSVTRSGNAVSVSRFSLNYTGNDNDGYHTIGTITLTTGTVLNINSWMYP